MKVLLDTNSLYYSSRVSVNEDIDLDKLLHIINRCENCYISSATVLEMIYRYRSRPKELRKIGLYIKNHNIKLLQIENLEFNDFELNYFASITQSKLNRILESAIVKRLKIESMYTCAILDIMVASYFYYNIIDNGKEPSVQFSSIFEKMITIINEINHRIVFEEYHTGYFCGDCENHIRRTFYGLVNYSIHYYTPLMEPFIHLNNASEVDEVIANFDWAGVEKNSKIIAKKISRKETPVKYLKSYFCQSRNNENLESINEYLEKYIYPNTQRIEVYSVRSFINEQVESMIKFGTAFSKNDILDRLILAELGNDMVLITFDEGIKAYMENNTDYSEAYLSSLIVISELARS